MLKMVRRESGAHCWNICKDLAVKRGREPGYA